MNFGWLKKIRMSFPKVLLLAIGLFFVILGNPISMGASGNEGIVVEYLRLDVQEQARQAWIKAEKESWEPWLAKQSGFLGRQMFWDKEKEEAMLLISWANREDWKSIPQSEVDAVQAQFEKLAREGTGQDAGNPFPLKFQGEFVPQ